MYDAPAGWHWGRKAEVAAIMGGGKVLRRPRKKYYWDQGGWDGYIWGGVFRAFFVFSDTLEVGGCLGASIGEGMIYSISAANMAEILPTESFAGIVCVAD